MYVATLLLGGLSHGALIALGAIGITLLFRVSRFANVAIGDTMTVGAYSALAVNALAPGNLLIMMCTGLAVGALLGVLSYWTCFRRAADSVTYFITSIGVALVLRAGVMLLWGTRPQGYHGFNLHGRAAHWLPMSSASLITMVACLVLGILFFYVVMRTHPGRLVRAVADDPDLARANGVQVHKVVLGVWCAVGAMVGLSGVLLGLGTQVNPNMGWDILLELFAAAILGGLGNIWGAVCGALVIGVITQMSSLFVSTQLTPAVALAIMILILLWRPTGIFKKISRI